MESNREKVLRALEQAFISVTSEAILEQSNTFVFIDGSLITFDGEVLSRQDSPFGKEIEGSVMAGDLLKVIQRFPDETLSFEGSEEELIIKGRRRSAGIKMMNEVLLPYQDVPIPKKFRKIPEGLREILIQASQVCGKDETAPKTTHIHIAEDRVEATDSYRVFRAEIETGIKNPILIHAINIAKGCKNKMKGICSTSDGWIHFLTEDEMEISIICSAEEYYPKKLINDLLKVSGEKVILPENLPEILSRAEVMDTPTLSIGGWDSQVTISIEENKIKVTSQKDEGWFQESKVVKYSGPKMRFSIHPLFLRDLCKRTREAIISDRQIKVEFENIHFTAALEAKGKE